MLYYLYKKKLSDFRWNNQYLDEEYKNKICLNKSLIILVKTVKQ